MILKAAVITALKRSFGKGMSLHMSVILFIGGKGVSLTETPLDRDPLDRDPLDTDPPDRDPRAVKSRQYASYWNVFLFVDMCLRLIDLTTNQLAILYQTGVWPRV